VFHGDKGYMFGRHGRAEKRQSEIGIHAVRGGTVVGEHTVLFLGDNEIIEITHKANPGSYSPMAPAGRRSS
jgi:4-hydroxy-tetrahydrodipicolinate reductase